MPEEQAFSVLVKIMFEYGLRDLFKQNFEDLHCKFFQLERLMQVCMLHMTSKILFSDISISCVCMQLVYLLGKSYCCSLFNFVSLRRNIYRTCTTIS